MSDLPSEIELAPAAISRRSLLTKAAVAGTVAWTAPVVSSMAQPVAAAVGSVCPSLYDFDDGTTQEAVAVAEQPVEDVADGPTLDETEAEQHPAVADRADHPPQRDGHADREHAEQRPEPAPEAERRARVEDESELGAEGTFDDASVVEDRRRPDLGDLVDDQQCDGDRQQPTAAGSDLVRGRGLDVDVGVVHQVSGARAHRP